MLFSIFLAISSRTRAKINRLENALIEQTVLFQEQQKTMEQMREQIQQLQQKLQQQSVRVAASIAPAAPATVLSTLESSRLPHSPIDNLLLSHGFDEQYNHSDHHVDNHLPTILTTDDHVTAGHDGIAGFVHAEPLQLQPVPNLKEKRKTATNTISFELLKPMVDPSESEPHICSFCDNVASTVCAGRSYCRDCAVRVNFSSEFTTQSRSQFPSFSNFSSANDLSATTSKSASAAPLVSPIDNLLLSQGFDQKWEPTLNHHSEIQQIQSTTSGAAAHTGIAGFIHTQQPQLQPAPRRATWRKDRE